MKSTIGNRGISLADAGDALADGGVAGSVANGDAAVLKQKLARGFFVKGVAVAVISGMAYGLYSAFVTVAMGKGVWADWYGPNAAGLSAFAVVYVIGVLGSGVNDMMSAVWAVLIGAAKGKLGDFARCLRTKPGLVMVVCAVIGGPIASAAYIIALQMAGSIIIPITALCPAIGAILGRVLFKQALSPRMVVGVGICLVATIMIGSTSMGADAPPDRLLGCVIAFVAALGWGVEGCVAGFGTVVIDYEIGITIRQVTSGIVNLAVLVPVVSLIAGNISLAPQLTAAAFLSGPAMVFFAVSGFCALFAFSLWYKGNSMCGSALGMACNGAYSFWGPFFCWVVIGVVFGQEGWALEPIAWVAAVVMFLGILLIAVNPFAGLGKKR